MSDLLVELFEGLSIPGFPSEKSVCAPAVYNGSSGRWTGELGIPCENQESVFLAERAIRNELLAPGQDVGIVLGG